MNTIKVKVNFTQGTCETTGINLVTGDYNSTKLEFTFDREDGTKVFEMKSPSEELVMVQEIQNNEIILYGEDENENIASIFTEEGKYIFEVSLYENESKLTSAKGQIKVKPEQVVIDGEVVEAYLPVFDQLLSQVSTALAQTNNLNLSSSKSGKITTITITKKDGTTETRQVLDGADFEYNWSGTSLGVKTSDEGTYTYVDLKGDRGEPGAIKMIIVAELPETGAEDTIYLTPKQDMEEGNKYAEYVYIDGEWELLGVIGIEVDMDDYATWNDLAPIFDDFVTNTDYATGSVAGVIKPSASFGTDVNASGVLFSTVISSSNYSSLSNYAFISKGTLENVLTARIGDIQTLLDNLDSGSGV